MSGKQPLRRSSRTTKAKSFGEDFEMENPNKKARKESEPSKQPDPPLPDDPAPVPVPDPEPTPGTSEETPDPDPDPEASFKWDSDPEHWSKPRLPTKHSKCSFISVSAGFRFVAARSKRGFAGRIDSRIEEFISKRGSAR